jgi:hypothetical protein
MDKQEMVFKTATFGGFDKTSVMNFIFKLNEETEEAQNKLKAQIEDLQGAKAQLEQELADVSARAQRLQSAADSTQASLSGEKERSNQLAAMNDDLQARLEQSQNQLSRQKAALQEAQQTNVDLTQELQATQQSLSKYQTQEKTVTDQLEAMRTQMDRHSAQIGKVLIKARSEAEAILEQAGKDGEEKIQQAEQAAQSILQDAAAAAERREADARATAAETAERTQRTITQARVDFAAFQDEVRVMCAQIVQTASDMMVQAGQVEAAVLHAEEKAEVAQESVQSLLVPVGTADIEQLAECAEQILESQQDEQEPPAEPDAEFFR